MTRKELVDELIALLLNDMPERREEERGIPHDLASRRRFLRALMNLRDPGGLSERYLALESELLSAEREERGVVRIADLAPTGSDARISLWRGDITRLDADAIVNAANGTLLGCRVPGHDCIDNSVHSAAGLALREECAKIASQNSGVEPPGRARITKAYNLPSKYVIHTVGPMVSGDVLPRDRMMLAACYHSCLLLAATKELESIAFCCISTGVFHFPHHAAANIALATVWNFLDRETSLKRVIFNVFTDEDEKIYRELLV